jgi:hypothetical protein
MPCPDTIYRREIVRRFWEYRTQEFVGGQSLFDRPSRTGDRPPVFTKATASHNVLRSAKAGRYHVDEIGSDLMPSGHTSRRWGVVINHADGTVTMDVDPWPND